MPGTPVVYSQAQRCVNSGPFSGIVASCFGLRGFPGIDILAQKGRTWLSRLFLHSFLRGVREPSLHPGTSN